MGATIRINEQSHLELAILMQGLILRHSFHFRLSQKHWQYAKE